MQKRPGGQQQSSCGPPVLCFSWSKMFICRTIEQRLNPALQSTHLTALKNDQCRHLYYNVCLRSPELYPLYCAEGQHPCISRTQTPFLLHKQTARLCRAIQVFFYFATSAADKEKFLQCQFLLYRPSSELSQKFQQQRIHWIYIQCRTFHCCCCLVRETFKKSGKKFSLLSELS